MESLAGRSYLIVGVGPGVGTALAERFAREGAAVGLAARSGKVSGPLAEKINVEGGKAHPITLDGLADGALIRGAEALAEATGRIDGAVVVANAFMMNPLPGLRLEEMMNVVKVKMGLTLHTAQALVASLDRFPDQRLVVVSTAGAFGGSAQMAPFNAAEWGVRGLAASIEAEWGDHGLRTTLLAVMGSLREHQDGSAKGYENLISVADVADAAVWVLSRPASQRYPELHIHPPA